MSIGSVWNSNTFPGKAAVAEAAICSLAVPRDIPNRTDEPANAATRAVSDEARRILASIGLFPESSPSDGKVCRDYLYSISTSGGIKGSLLAPEDGFIIVN